LIAGGAGSDTTHPNPEREQRSLPPCQGGIKGGWLLVAPKVRRAVATGRAQPGVSRAKRNPWERVDFSRTRPGGAEEASKYAADQSNT